jgi:transcriptional regulator with XRE-family HTH domain
MSRGHEADRIDNPRPKVWNDKAFRDRVRSLARARGIGLGELAKRAGVSEPWLRHAPSKGRQVDTILRVAAVLNVSPYDLIMTATADANPEALDRLVLAFDVAARTYVALDGLPDVGPADLLRRLREIIGSTSVFVTAWSGISAIS